MKRQIKYLIIGFTSNVLIFAIGWWQNRLIEMIIILVSFFYFRSKWDKQYHSYHCFWVSLIVFYLIGRLSYNIGLSILIETITAYLITLISYHVKDYFDNKKELKKLNTKPKIKITRGMNKDLLYKMCADNYLNEEETKLMIYYYCDKMKLDAISIKLNYSEITIKRKKSELLKRLD